MNTSHRWLFRLILTPVCLGLILTGLLIAPDRLAQPVQADTYYALEEDFEGAFPPAGWQVIDNTGSGAVWQRSDTAGVPNLCAAGSGNAAVAHPWDSNGVNWDTELRSPPIDLTEAGVAVLEYASHFQDYAGNGEIWLDVSTDGGASWTTLRNQTADDPPGGTPTVGGTLETEDLTPYIGRVIVLRWRFQATNSAAWMWHIDEVSVEATEGYNIDVVITTPIEEGFEGAFPPDDWQVIDNAGSGAVWQSSADRGVDNLCASGSGNAAVAHPWDTNGVNWDTELRSPPIDLAKADIARLQYASHFQDYAGNGEIWLDISTDGGESWTTLRNQTSDDPPGGAPAVGGTLEVEDLTPYIGQVIVLRWRFQAINSPAWMWHIDEVSVEAVFYRPRLANSYIIAPRILPPGDAVSYHYIVAIQESTAVPDFEWGWDDVTLVNDFPAGTVYRPDSLWCSDGNCQQDDTSVYWSGRVANNSDAYLVFAVDAIAPVCGQSIINTAVFSQTTLAEPVEISAVTAFWDDVWLDESMALFPPPGWSVNDYGGSLQPGSVFTDTDPGRRDNQTGGRGDFIIVDDIAAGTDITVETDLRLPALDIPLCSDTTLVFKTAFESQSITETAEVQISTDGGASWDVLLHWDTDVPGPHMASVDLTPYAGTTGAILRFYYDDGGTDAGWWQIDDVQVVGCPRQGHPPVADDDAFTVTEDSPAVVLDVLDGDTDIDYCESLTISAVGVPSQGGSVINGGTVVTYTPAANFYGTEVFTYTVSDGAGGDDTAAVTVTVEAVNDSPTISVIPTQYTTKDNPFLLSITIGDVETAVDSLILTKTSSTPALVPESSIVFAGSGAQRTVTITPTAGLTGTTTITLTVSDGTASSSSSFTLVVGEQTAFQVYLPLVSRAFVSAPDLVVQRIDVASNGVAVVIANQGGAPVVDNFWVDLYVNPTSPPTGVNQTWQTRGEQGIAWGVSASLAPGEILTLTSAGPDVFLPYTNFDGVDVGDVLYVQVDSAAQNSSFGAVLETHEITGEAYNNIATFTVPVGGNAIAPLHPPPGGTAPVDAELPRRPSSPSDR